MAKMSSESGDKLGRRFAKCSKDVNTTLHIHELVVNYDHAKNNEYDKGSV